MAYVHNWLHCVWGTKYKRPFLIGSLKYQVIEHIIENGEKNGIFIDCINGYKDHIHCLIRLRPDQTLAKTIQFIKGESSYWINKEELIKRKFKWAIQYYAVSVSDKDVPIVRRYIKNQEKHHKAKSCEKEYIQHLYQ
jgi:putative transposase